MPVKPKKLTKVAARTSAPKRTVRAKPAAPKKPAKRTVDPHALTAEDVREIQLGRAEYAAGHWIEGDVVIAEMRRRTAAFLARRK